jgi:hypothetical protein
MIRFTAPSRLLPVRTALFPRYHPKEIPDAPFALLPQSVVTSLPSSPLNPLGATLLNPSNRPSHSTGGKLPNAGLFTAAHFQSSVPASSSRGGALYPKAMEEI